MSKTDTTPTPTHYGSNTYYKRDSRGRECLFAETEIKPYGFSGAATQAAVDLAAEY